MIFTEREVHQAVGHLAQLASHRPEHVPQQLPLVVAGSAARSEGHCRPPDQHHVLPDEGMIFRSCNSNRIMYN